MIIMVSSLSHLERFGRLHKSYDTQAVEAKKYMIRKYFSFQMKDGKSIVAQTHELQMIVHEIQLNGIKSRNRCS